MAIDGTISTWTDAEHDSLRQHILAALAEHRFAGEPTKILVSGSRVYRGFDETLPGHTPDSDLDVFAYYQGDSGRVEMVSGGDWQGIRIAIKVQWASGNNPRHARKIVASEWSGHGLDFPVFHLARHAYEPTGSADDVRTHYEMKQVQRGGRPKPLPINRRLDTLESRIAALEQA